MFRQLLKLVPPRQRKPIVNSLINLYNTIAFVTGIQRYGDKIGRLKVPFTSKSYLKKSFAQQGEDLVLDRIITRYLRWDPLVRRTYVDIGAYHALDHSVTYLLYRRGWRGLVFDPSLDTMKSFETHRKRDVFINAVVGDTDLTEVSFYVHSSAQGDRSLVNSKVPKAGEDYTRVTKSQVRLDAALTRAGFNCVDVLSIDVEGAELEILETIDFGVITPAVVVIEIHATDVAAALRTPEAELLHQNGYVLVANTVITYFFVRQQ